MWADLVAWFQSPAGARVLQSAIIPAATILVAGVVALLVARAAVRAAAARADRAEAATAVALVVEAARAATDPGAGRRRTSRLRTEADVRLRLLPLPGAAAAADWAAGRLDGSEAPEAGGSPVDVDGLRDRLVAWAARPSRARRLFAPERPVRPVATAPAEEAASATLSVEQRAAPVEQRAAPIESSVPQSTARPDETVPEVPVVAVSTPPRAPEPVVAATSPSADDAGVPAWQRTRAVERLQQERARTRTPGAAAVDGEQVVDTAPVKLQHAHRALAGSAGDADASARPEVHARHARPAEGALAAAAGAPASAAGAASSAGPAGSTGSAGPAGPTPLVPPNAPTPAWLDTYDDEAQVTQNLNLKTPPPVSATAVRDRGGVSDDLVPRA